MRLFKVGFARWPTCKYCHEVKTTVCMHTCVCVRIGMYAHVCVMCVCVMCVYEAPLPDSCGGKRGGGGVPSAGATPDPFLRQHISRGAGAWVRAWADMPPKPFPSPLLTCTQGDSINPAQPLKAGTLCLKPRSKALF